MARGDGLGHRRRQVGRVRGGRAARRDIGQTERLGVRHGAALSDGDGAHPPAVTISALYAASPSSIVELLFHRENPTIIRRT
jgi:hypothetical protein